MFPYLFLMSEEEWQLDYGTIYVMLHYLFRSNVIQQI